MSNTTVRAFFSAFMWRQRVRELESSTTRSTGDLSQLAELVFHSEKRSQWLRKQYRKNHRNALIGERELAMARCYLAAAEILESIERSVGQHFDGVSGPELEEQVARTLKTMLTMIEQLLQSRDTALSQLHVAPPQVAPTGALTHGPDDAHADAGGPEV